MPTDDVLWAGIVVTGVFVAVSYLLLSWARSVRRQLSRLSESAGVLEFSLTGLRSDVGELTRLLGGKIGAAQTDSMFAGFAAAHARPVKRSKMVVKRRG